MKYTIQQQFIPLNDQIWVTKLNEGDEDFLFDTLAEAEAKATELQESDPTGRKYKAIPSNNTESNSI
jgi:hypothetical protein